MDGAMTINKLPFPKAVIFDWDDTLVDTWPVAFAAINTMLEAMGHAAWSEEEANRRIGPSARDLFPQLFGDRWQEADKIFIDAIRSGFRDNMKTIEGASSLLKAFSDMNIFIGIVSNKRGQLLREEVTALSWNSYFKAVVGAGDAMADKPDPATVHLALKDSGIAPGPDVWFIGNNHMDMLCAHSAGCTPILLETKLPPEEFFRNCPPAMRFPHCAALLDYIAPKKGYPHLRPVL